MHAAIQQTFVYDSCSDVTRQLKMQHEQMSWNDFVGDWTLVPTCCFMNSLYARGIYFYQH